MIIKKNILFLILSSFVTFIYSGTDGTIRGQVTDKEGTAMIGAQVFIQEIGKGAIVDVDGNYILLNIPVGTYDVTCQMLGYASSVYGPTNVSMDQTTWLNFVLESEAIQGETVYVSGERDLVEKGSTSKKVTINKEAIEALPIRDVTELYNLQSGVVKVESKSQGIPNHEERGLDEVHVRGGRSGEIAYMIDGMYIRNPIYGGIGNGTRLNKFAIQEFDWQPGGFNAEYGDAMSAVSNLHTMSGKNNFMYKFQYETSLFGEALGSVYDKLRDYHDYNFGFGGPLPGYNKIKIWFSGQMTNKGAYRVLKFDNSIYQFQDGENFYFDQLQSLWDTPEWDDMKYSFTYPWDNTAGYRAFGSDKTSDYFAKITYDITNQHKLNLSLWDVTAHRKGFGYNTYLYWDEGQNELFRDTRRIALEFNHTINSMSFYTLRISSFTQEQFIGVRWNDTDDDGYPDWFEWGNPAGYSDYSDPKNKDIVPFKFSNSGEIIYYSKTDGQGPEEWTSGWYFGAEPGNYNWSVAEIFSDLNQNGVWDAGESFDDADGDGQWDGPVLVESAIYKDGSYWLTPEMYVDYENFYDAQGAYLNYEGLSPAMTISPYLQYLAYFEDDSDQGNNPQPLYFRYWFEDKSYGGHDRFYSESTAQTNEIRFDYTHQLTDKWRARVGFDYKFHELNYYEVENPWDDASAFRQRFAEQWDDFGEDNEEWINTDSGPDAGEGNGTWDPGETFDDFNNDGIWNDFVQPEEFAMYWQNTFEVPWMVVNAGVRVDAVNYNTKIWADPYGNYSPYAPHFYFDCGTDVDAFGDPLCPGDQGDDINDPTQGNRQWDEGEQTTDNITEAGRYAYVIFKDSDWLYKVSPRLGISHVISDDATFTFNYGLYYQTPVYEYIYRNVSKLEDPGQTFEDAGREGSGIGNATMSAGRTQSYEFGFNVQMGATWAISTAIWVKDMDQLTTAKQYNSGVYEYKVAKNGDFGSAIGYDLTVETRGDIFNTMIQYTYSVAKASSEYDAAAFGDVIVDAPQQEFLMPYDRTHDLTVSIYSNKLPWGLNAGLTGFFQSGYPYTPVIFNGDQPTDDLKNKNTKRSPSLFSLNLSLSKGFKIGNHKITLGTNVFNLLDDPYPVDIYRLSGNATYPGAYYDKSVGKYVSGSYYDRPWMYSDNREINFFVRIDFN